MIWNLAILFGLILSPIITWAQTFSALPTGGRLPISRPAFTGAPFSGQRVIETRRPMADGTTLTLNGATQRLFRDSQGRTRTESAMGPGAAADGKTVEIHDPVSGYRYVLDEQGRVALRMQFVPPPVGPPGSAPIPVAPPSTARSGYTTELLGAQTMEGVTVEGTLTTMTVPVGVMGNDQELTVTTEIWQCRGLGETILKKSFDPRRGEISTRLTNIILAEPDASLFQPPPGYEIVDE